MRATRGVYNTGSQFGNPYTQHKPESGKKIYDVLKKYDICQKLFCITADGASNNGTMCEDIERLLSEDGISWSAEKNRIHYMNHVINLAVQDFLKRIKAISTKNANGSDFVEEEI